MVRRLLLCTQVGMPVCVDLTSADCRNIHLDESEVPDGARTFIRR